MKIYIFYDLTRLFESEFKNVLITALHIMERKNGYFTPTPPPPETKIVLKINFLNVKRKSSTPRPSLCVRVRSLIK